MTKTSLPSTASFLLGTAFCLGLGACDPDVEDAAVDGLELANDGMRLVEYEVLAELVTDDGETIVLTREPIADDSEEYTVGTKMTGSAGGLDYGKLILEQELTPLEVFLAFAPEGAEVPEELQVIHDAIADHQGRETYEPRELMVPRALGISSDHVNCESFGNFTTAVDGTWTWAYPRDQVTSSQSVNHSVSRNGWHAAYGMACNSASGPSTDTKLVSMCRRLPGSSWSCEAATLSDGDYAWKSWSIVGSGGAYSTFDFQLNGINDAGSTLSYLGLVVIAAIG